MRFEGYDAVVVGTGFGGSACALVLAKAGMKVLVLERGDWARRDDADWNPRAILIEKRYQGPSPLQVRQREGTGFQDVAENEVVGGMSVFYGGASLRLRAEDFSDWPISYADLRPYYVQAEALLEVHGQAGVDPFEPPGLRGYPFAPVALTAPAQRIFQAGKALGLRPFQLPMALNFSNAERTLCIQCLTCDGFPCKIAAKNDTTATLLKCAQEAGASVVAGVQVGQVVLSGDRVRGLMCADRASKRVFEVAAPVVVLGAGALQSPGILLRSGLDGFPQRDRIGRFLMRHCNAVVAGVFPFRTNPTGAFHKQVCFSDFYEDFRAAHGKAAGLIQDIYTPPPVALRHFAPFGFKRAAAFASAWMQNLLCVAEDEPQAKNAVSLSGEVDAFGFPRVRVEHHYSVRDRARRAYLVAQAKRILRQAGALFCHAYEIDTFSHAVGTLRMGDDPKTSVLDRDGRFWGIENLFVADGSAFTTSGGVNPSLTIAANALRVGERIAKAQGRLKIVKGEK